MQELNAAMGISDDYDFFSATELLSQDPETPNIFQNVATTNVAAGRIIALPGLPRFPMPLEMSSTSYTEAVGFIQDGNFLGVMRLSYDFTFSKVSPQARTMLLSRLGQIPNKAHMTRAGRFEIELQGDI